MPSLGLSNTSVQCRDVQAISRFDADSMRALRQCGRLRVGDAVYGVTWHTGVDGLPRIVATSLRHTPNATKLVQALHRRESELSVHGGDYAGLLRLWHVCDLASAPATSAFPELQPLKDVLAAGAGEFCCGGHRYAVAVHVQRSEVSVSVRRTDLAQNRLLRFIQAVRDMFRRCSLRSRAATMARMLTELARTQTMVAERVVPALCGTADAASAGPVAEAPARTRARRALANIRARARRANSERGISGNLPKHYPEVDLARIGPADMDWSGIDLSRLDLSATNLKRFNLAGANLEGALLYFCDLSDAVLANANLNHADIDSADLTGATLVGATLTGTKLQGTTLRHANLAGADLRSAVLDFRTDLSHCCLIGANLSGQRLINTHLPRADLTRANLEKANLSSAVLTGARLVGASLQHANLEDGRFAGTDFHGARLARIWAGCGDFLQDVCDGAGRDIELDLLLLSVPDMQEQYLNHRANRTSLQRNIDAIGDETLKLKLMSQLLNAVQATPVSGVMDGAEARRGAYLSMLDVLIGNPLYCRADPSIAQLVATCCENELSRYNLKLLPASLSDAVLYRYMQAALARIRVPWGAARNHAVSVMQLVFAARNGGRAPRVTELAAELEQSWLQALPEALRQCVESTREVACEGLLPLVGPDDGAGILMSQDYFVNRILGQPLAGPVKDIKWEMLWVYQHERPTHEGAPALYVAKPVTDIGEALGPFPLLFQAFQKRNQAPERHRLLEAMAVGPFTPWFLDAMSATGSKHKLIALDQQKALQAHLAPHLAGRWEAAVLTEEHVASLLRAYPSLTLADDPRGTGFFLLCLSAIMTRLSSSYFLGSETDSPVALRGYAGALLNHGRKLAPGMMEPAIWRDWHARLFGLKEAFSCTAILGDMMREHLATMARNDEHRSLIRQALMPAAWE